jgi:hypothetical protein
MRSTAADAEGIETEPYGERGKSSGRLAGFVEMSESGVCVALTAERVGWEDGMRMRTYERM